MLHNATECMLMCQNCSYWSSAGAISADFYMKLNYFYSTQRNKAQPLDSSNRDFNPLNIHLCTPTASRDEGSYQM